MTTPEYLSYRVPEYPVRLEGKMALKNAVQRTLEPIVRETLAVFLEISSAAKNQLAKRPSYESEVLANTNTFTSNEALRSLALSNDSIHKDLEELSREPAIARVVVQQDDGEEVTYFICRAAPPSGANPQGAFQLASYRSPFGRIASLPVSEEDYEIETPGGIACFKVLEKAELHPRLKNEWDSINSVLRGQGYGPFTINSFLSLLGTDEDDTSLKRLLNKEKTSRNILEKRQRNVINKMSLRDQPLLDQYQDAIFRLPLESRLLILGPPGSGKTTTLIRRLGQKLDVQFLEENEHAVIERAKHSGALEHKKSWIMFTPTELLKQYLKESFAREGIAASDSHINTWPDFRRQLARNQFNVLQTSTGRGSFIQKDNLPSLQDTTFTNQIEWFEDFQVWQETIFWKEINEAVHDLSARSEIPVGELGGKLSEIVKNATTVLDASTFVSIHTLSEEVRGLISSKKSSTDAQIEKALNAQLDRDDNFLGTLAEFVGGLTDADDDQEEQEEELDLEGEEGIDRPKAKLAAAAESYMRTVRAQARARSKGRTLNRNSRSGQISEWIGERSIDADQLSIIGESLHVQSSARKFLSPVRRYLRGIPSRYRRYRRIRQGEGKWYTSGGFAPNEISPLESDVILLSILRSATTFLRDSRIRQNIDDQQYSVLKGIMDLSRNQVVVDEATDFSPLQLACMDAISSPRIKSFFACGDFNQRMTKWGCRSASEMEWALPNIDIQSILITYRHSKQLNDLAKEIVHLCGGDSGEAALPEDVDSDGVPAVLGKRLGDHQAIASWLAQRITEIERFTETLPTISILVNSEGTVGPTAEALKQALSVQNIEVVACHNGRVVGQDDAVRVFDVQHIKGLEFEAVFFVGIDQLAETNPTLFDKYLYVGATRAATYLGLTCTSESLPTQLTSLEPSFVSRWET